MRKLVLTGLLMAGLSLVPLQGADARRRAKGSKLRAMTFNIRFDFENDGQNRWANRVDLIVKSVQQADPDVVCLQEDKTHQIEDLQPKLTDYEFIGRGRNATGSGERCSILYKKDVFKVKDSGSFWLSDTPDVPGSNTWRDKYPRVVTWALLVPKANKSHQVLVLNTHLAEGNRDDIRRRGAEVMADWLKARVSGKDAEEIHVVISGDFNTGEGTDPYRVLTDGEVKLRDAWKEGKTVAKSPGTFSGFRGLQTQERIDWILLGGPTRALRVVKMEDKIDDRWPSDHYALVADVELR